MRSRVWRVFANTYRYSGEGQACATQTNDVDSSWATWTTPEFSSITGGITPLWSVKQNAENSARHKQHFPAMHSSFLQNLSALPRLTCYPNVGHRANDHLSRETVHRAASIAVQLVAELEAVHQKLSRGKQVELAIYKM